MNRKPTDRAVRHLLKAEALRMFDVPDAPEDWARRLLLTGMVIAHSARVRDNQSWPGACHVFGPDSTFGEHGRREMLQRLHQQEAC